MSRELIYEYGTERLIGPVAKIESHGAGVKVYVDTGNRPRANFDFYDRLNSDYYRYNEIRSHYDKKSQNTFPGITKVIFNNPATIVFFDDGDKIVVKCAELDDFDPYIGICMAIVKKVYKNQSANYMVKRLVNKYYYDPRNYLYLGETVLKGITDGLRRTLGLIHD